MRLRVGLIGLGEAWQQRHAPALRALADRFEVRAVCDQVAHRAEQAAAEFGAAALDGYRALARREDVDAVLILASQWFGALPVLAACEFGKPIYCADGLDLEPEAAQRVERCVERAGIFFMVEFPRRHAPATTRLKELIATRLGPPRMLFCHLRSAAPRPKNHHWGRRIAPGTLACSLIELVDWCCYVVDRSPTYVTGLVHSAPLGADVGEDYQMMSLDFSEPDCPGQGPLAQLSCGRYIPSDWQEAVTYRPLAALQVSCEQGIAFVDLPATIVWFDEAGRHQESLESERPVGEQLLARFHHAVTTRACGTCDLEAAYRALRVVEEARRSHGEGRRIRL